jgi:hypothetical protein
MDGTAIEVAVVICDPLADDCAACVGQPYQGVRDNGSLRVSNPARNASYLVCWQPAGWNQ